MAFRTMTLVGRHLSRVVVTGGAGFIGSHLCERLAGEGVRVVAVDNLSTGRIENIAHLLGGPRFQLLKADVGEPIEVDGPVDAVLHLASPTSPRDYQRMPIETLRAGTAGTDNALRLALAKRASFLLASTSEVYGDPEVHPQPEGYWGHVNPVGPRSCYDEAKRAAEAFVTAYHDVHRVDTRIVRIFNTYGPRMRADDGRAIPTFLAQALSGRPITVFGDGSQTRSLCYVDDLVDGLLRLLASGYHAPLNLGNPDEMTVLRLAQTVRRVTGSDSPIVTRPLPVDDPRRRRPDISVAVRVLGWRPAVSLDEGLRRMLAVEARLCGRAE